MEIFNKRHIGKLWTVAFLLFLACRNSFLWQYTNTFSNTNKEQRRASSESHTIIGNLSTSANVHYVVLNDSNASDDIATEEEKSQNVTNVKRSNQHTTSTDHDMSSLQASFNETINNNSKKGPLVYQWRVPDETFFGGLHSKKPLLLQYCNSWYRNKKDNLPWKTFPRQAVPGYKSAFNEDGRPRNQVQVLLNASGIFHESDSGTGNWIVTLYALRYILSSQSTPDPKPHGKKPNRNDFQLISLDAEESQDSAVLPWLSGYFDSDDSWKVMKDYWAPHKVPKMDCSILQDGFIKIPIMWSFPIFQYELRRMALHLVGPPAGDPDHPAHTFPPQMDGGGFHPSYQLPLASSTYPLFPNVELDDVAIHFRCGDIMDSDHAWFRFVKFSAYVRRIDGNTTKSIGIVTQPFNDRTRYADRWDDPRGDFFRHRVCEDVVRGMHGVLQDAFPHTRVSIRNDPSETVALAFARLILAKQAFAAPDSTFSILPVLSSFGRGYHLRPYGANLWLTSDETLFAKAIGQVIMDEPLLMNAATTKMLRQYDEERAPHHILQWFLNDTYVLPPNATYNSA